MADLGASFCAPTAKASSRVSAASAACAGGSSRSSTRSKVTLSLERHGAHTMPGLLTRISQRLLALAAGLWHNWNIGDPGRHLTAYDH